MTSVLKAISDAGYDAMPGIGAAGALDATRLTRDVITFYDHTYGSPSQVHLPSIGADNIAIVFIRNRGSALSVRDDFGNLNISISSGEGAVAINVGDNMWAGLILTAASLT